MFLFVRLFKSRGSVLSFDILHVQIFIQQSILGAIKILWKWSKMLVVAGDKKKNKKNTGVERGKNT